MAGFFQCWSQSEVTKNDAVSGVAYTVKAKLGLRGFDESEGASRCLCALSQALTSAEQPSSRWGGHWSFALKWCTNISAQVLLFHPLTVRAGLEHMELPGPHTVAAFPHDHARVHCAQLDCRSHCCLLCLQSVMPSRVLGEVVSPGCWNRCLSDVILTRCLLLSAKRQKTLPFLLADYSLVQFKRLLRRLC